MIGGDDWKVLLLKCVVLVVFLLTAFAYLTLAERKVSARIQLRWMKPSRSRLPNHSVLRRWRGRGC